MSIDTYAVARAAIELADANPEFVYSAPLLVADDINFFDGPEGSLLNDLGDEISPEDGNCVYVENKVGSCLFGQALLATGVEVELLLANEGENISSVLEPKAQYRDYSPLTLAMERVQKRQDGGDPWGEAIIPLKDYFAARVVATVPA